MERRYKATLNNGYRYNVCFRNVQGGETEELIITGDNGESFCYNIDYPAHPSFAFDSDFIRLYLPTLWKVEAQDVISIMEEEKEAQETDPHGRDPHTPGAKLDAGKVRVDLIFDDMALALLEVAKVATHGAHKYTEGGWIEVPNGHTRYTAAMDRHRLAEAIEPYDPDSQLLHAAHLAWNALARLELILRKQLA